MAIRPIFVLGLQRSGTTWIGNLLEAHSRVAAVAASRHQGIHESLFFSHFARAWDWSDPDQRQAAVSAFLSSDYGTLMQLHDGEKERVRAAGGAAETFAAAMNLFAWSQGAEAWVEKSPHHTRHAEQIAGDLPQARFVAIHRKTVSLLASRLHAYGRTPPRGLRRARAVVRAAVSNAYHKRLMDRLARRHPGRVVQLDYDTFKAGGEVAIATLLHRLDLPAAPGLTPRFRPNSSFAAGERQPLTAADRILAGLAALAVATVPTAVLSAMRAVARPARITFPAWVWRDDAQRPGSIAIADRRAKAPQDLRAA